ncbi:TadE/TadG family type IV pilus assembly protein [Blastomonas sp.]|uniref:TadE/TadG family type IV pilus assembly protein n=1 Tax=Blastomonas sp. TaxID=1909299 RepID=UPI0035941F4E
MSLRRNLADTQGATIVEFAFVAPILLMILWGGINLSMLGFSAANLRYATEEAARCAAVRTTVCSNADETRAYASANFNAITSAQATFVAAMAESCGKQVDGSLDFVVQTGVGSVMIPLTATACFPQ